MTENKRKAVLKDLREGYMDVWDDSTMDELFSQIEEEHKEIQQYRAIGTIEEFKALKDKSEPKEPIDKSKNPTDWHVMACPCCEHVFWNSGQFVRYQPKFCNYCGQKIDWQ